MYTSFLGIFSRYAWTPTPSRLCRNWQNHTYWCIRHSGIDPESRAFSKYYVTGCRIKSGITARDSTLFRIVTKSLRGGFPVSEALHMGILSQLPIAGFSGSLLLPFFFSGRIFRLNCYESPAKRDVT